MVFANPGPKRSWKSSGEPLKRNGAGKATAIEKCLVA